jgi:cohesin complex subunit SCC1
LELEGDSSVLHADEGVGLAADSSLHQQSELELPGDHDAHDQSGKDLSDDECIAYHDDGYDDTVVPAAAGPVSVGTKHAVHILRDQFESTKQKKGTVAFQDLLPEGQTTKSDATKMFFEILVLATKDAVKVEQPSHTVGGRLRIRAKEGLWGAWAETEASGEASRDEVEATA